MNDEEARAALDAIIDKTTNGALGAVLAIVVLSTISGHTAALMRYLGPFVEAEREWLNQQDIERN